MTEAQRAYQREYMRAYRKRAYVAEKIKAARKRATPKPLTEAQKEARRERARQHNARPEVKARKLAWQRHKRATDEATRRRNREYMQEYLARAEVRAKVRERNSLRKKRTAVGRAPAMTAEAVCALLHSDTRCCYCGVTFGEARATWKSLDHVRPLSAGGAHTPANVVLACVGCNSAKADKTLWDEWVPPLALQGKALVVVWPRPDGQGWQTWDVEAA